MAGADKGWKAAGASAEARLRRKILIRVAMTFPVRDIFRRVWTFVAKSALQELKEELGVEAQAEDLRCAVREKFHF